MKSLRLLAALAAVLGVAGSAHADTVWNLNATFTYNQTFNTATGTLTLGPSSVVSYDVLVSGTNTQADVEYTPANSFSPGDTTTQINFYDPGTNQYIVLVFASTPYGKTSGTINLTSSSLVCPGCGTLQSGSITAVTAATPEPGSLALLGTGIGAVALRLRRRFIM